MRRQPKSNVGHENTSGTSRTGRGETGHGETGHGETARGETARGETARGETARARMKRETRWRRLFTVLTVGLGLGLLPVAEASAGGPTSVLLTSPSSGEAAALTRSDARYRSLEELLGPEDAGGERERPASLDSAVGARQINVTWMAFDLRPARTDRVFPGEDPDTVWIHTATGVPDTYRGLWHRAAEPERLVALFDDLGLTGPSSTEKGGPALFPETWEDKGLFGQEDEQATASEKKDGPGSASVSPPEASGASTLLDHWWWAIPGLAVGSASTLVALRSRKGPREPRVRQELIDG